MPERTLRHFDRKLDAILRRAAVVFCQRGYHHASIRDISRATGVSLAGLYYYFQSKDQLLYLIQRHAFETLLRRAQRAVQEPGGPEDRLRALVRLHLAYFLKHPHEMKVLTHEEGALKDEFRRQLKLIKKAYYQLCFHQVEALKQAQNLSALNTRLAVLSLFGMMNWIYTWHNPKIDPGVEVMAAQMSDTFLHGALGGWARPENGAGQPMSRSAKPAGRPGQARTLAARARLTAPPRLVRQRQSRSA